MKTNAVIRIVIFSIVIILLLGILAAGLGVGMLVFDISIGNNEYITGSGSVDASQVKDLTIDWAAGSILIDEADVDTISFAESGKIVEGQEMVYALNGNTLSISYSKPAIQIGLFSTPEKDLVITVPSDWLCEDLSIDSASSDITVNNLKANSIDLSSASGKCEFNNCDIVEVDIDTASGDIYYVGILSTLDCDAASADVTAVLTNFPQRINMDSASGNLDLTLPEDTGFTVELDSLSGKFQSDFDTKSNSGQYVHGNGECKIDMDGASGSIRIRKG